jgi:chromosome segregation ATPase
MVDADKGGTGRGRARKADAARPASKAGATRPAASAGTQQPAAEQAGASQAGGTAAVRTAIADLYESLNETARRIARQQDELIAQAQDDLDSVSRECDEALREPAAALRAATETTQLREAEDAYRTAHLEQSRQAADREIAIRGELSAALENLEQEADDEISRAWTRFATDVGQALIQAAGNANSPADVRELRRQIQTLTTVVPQPFADAFAR